MFQNAPRPSERLLLLKDGLVSEIEVGDGLDALGAWIASGAQAARLVDAGGRPRGMPFGRWPDTVPAGTGGGVDAYDGSTPVAPIMLAPRHGTNARDLAMVAERFGPPGTHRTLEEIGGPLGLTRERVRQVLARHLRRVEEDVPIRAAVAARVRALAAEGPPGLADVLAQPWAAGLNAQAACFLVERYCGLIPVSAHDLGPTFLPVSVAVWDAAGDRLAVAAGTADPDEPVDGVRRRAIEGLVLKASAVEALDAALARAHPGRDVIGLRQRLCTVGCFVDALLPPGTPPRPLADIVSRQHASSPERLSPRQMEVILYVHGLRVEGGLFASLRGSPIDPALATRMVSLCVAAMEAGEPGKRWTTDNLSEAVRAGGRRLPSRIDEVDLGRILAADHRLAMPRAGIWTLAAPVPRHATREDVAIHLLERAGRPMTLRDLKRGVLAIWGNRPNEQLRSMPRLIRVGKREWGLVERDLDIRPAIEAALVDRARTLMRDGPARVLGVLASLADDGVTDLPCRYLAAAVLRARHGLRETADKTLIETAGGPRSRPHSITGRLVEALRSAGPEGLGFADLRAVTDASREALSLPESRDKDRIVLTVLQRSAQPHPDLPGRWIPRAWVDGKAPPLPTGAKPSVPRKVRPKPEKGVRAHRPPAPAEPSSPAPDQEDGSPWTRERVALLTRMWMAGETRVAIAAALGPWASHNAVTGKINRLGLYKHPARVSRVRPGTRTEALEGAASEASPSRAV